jgi:hypothetical protein
METRYLKRKYNGGTSRHAAVQTRATKPIVVAMVSSLATNN